MHMIGPILVLTESSAVASLVASTAGLSCPAPTIPTMLHTHTHITALSHNAENAATLGTCQKQLASFQGWTGLAELKRRGGPISGVHKFTVLLLSSVQQCKCSCSVLPTVYIATEVPAHLEQFQSHVHYMQIVPSEGTCTLPKLRVLCSYTSLAIACSEPMLSPHSQAIGSYQAISNHDY